MSRSPDRWDTAAGESLLNDYEDEVVERFRAGESLKSLEERFGTRNTNVRRWLVAHGEYDRSVVCGIPECDVEFPVRPGKLYCCRLHTKRADARNQYAKPSNKQKNIARNRVSKALQTGKLERPPLCERCNEIPGEGIDGRSLLQADHYMGYSQKHYLTIQWLCHDCDRELEMERKGRDDSRVRVGEKIGQWQVLDDRPGTRRSVAKLVCKCECGNESAVLERMLRSRRSLKCADCSHADRRRDD